MMAGQILVVSEETKHYAQEARRLFYAKDKTINPEFFTKPYTAWLWL